MPRRRASPPSPQEAESPVRPLTPLPDEEYPRRVSKRPLGKGYWLAYGLTTLVRAGTPLAFLYAIWFFAIRKSKGGLLPTILAAYCVLEVVYTAYYVYLFQLVQKPSPASELPLETRKGLFFKVLKAGLLYPVPSLPFPLDEPRKEVADHANEMYRAGSLSAAQLHRAREWMSDHTVLSQREAAARMTAEEKKSMEAFLERFPGEREQRLRKEVELEDLSSGQDANLTEEEMARRQVEFKEQLRKWFGNAEWSDIKSYNVLIWLAWSCFGISVEEARANPTWAKFLDDTLAILEEKTGSTFLKGFDPRIKVMRLTLDKVNAKPRPFIIYVLSNITNWFIRDILYPHQGVQLHREGDIEYLLRIPPGWTPEKGKLMSNAMPIVYLHGLGFGLLQNHLLVKHLIKSLPTHPIVVPLAPHTSQAFFHPRHLRPWNRRELVETVKAICTRWRFWEEPQAGNGGQVRGGVSLLSHSNGSVAHAWILKDCPSLARRNTFVDPVVLCLWEGDVCYNFCYREPRTALELLLQYFIASEVGIASYIQRHFDWAENTLFIDEIPHATNPRKTAFFLGAEDIIIDAPRARRYLERNGVSTGLHWDPHGGHGDGLAGASRDRVVMFAGTGSTSGWEHWRTVGRRRHTMESTRRDRRWSSEATAVNDDGDDSDRYRGGDWAGRSKEKEA